MRKRAPKRVVYRKIALPPFHTGQKWNANLSYNHGARWKTLHVQAVKEAADYGLLL